MFQPPLPVGGEVGCSSFNVTAIKGDGGLRTVLPIPHRRDNVTGTPLPKPPGDRRTRAQRGVGARERAPLCLAPGVQPPLEHPRVPVLTSQ